jgi:hypothetical protein
MPTFRPASSDNPTFLRLYAKSLGKVGFDLPFDERHGTYRRYTGDVSVPGKGEILVWHANGS